MTANFLVLIVVYGVKPAETPSLRSLRNCDSDNCSLQVVIWDNSHQEHQFETANIGSSCLYVSTPQNLGLSTIYNRVISDHLQESQYLILLDHDTDLPIDFLRKASAAIAAHPEIDLFLPMVRANGRWSSPITYLFGWGWQWKSRVSGIIPSQRVCAINSGMIISARYLRGSFPGYDERLRFYGTDTQFMLDYMDRRPKLFVLDVILNHDLSFFSGPEAQRASKFATIKRAYDFIYEKRPLLQQLTVRAVMLLMSVRYAIRYRDLAFLRRSDA